MIGKKSLIFILIILAVAAFFRLWQLDSIPPGLYPDVAINGNDALDSLKSGNLKVFYPENNGREGLMIWLIALSFSVFGVSIFSIKIVAAIIGILTVLGFYLLTKELFFQYNENCSRYISFLSSFFLAISFWHTNFSRIGFRAILLPFILVFAFYFLFKGFREKRIFYFPISGIFFGLGFYTYISYRFIIFLLPLILICWWFIYQKQNLRKIFMLNTLYLILAIIIVALPIGIYFLQNPQDFVGRATPISIFATENPIKEFGKSLILHLGMFNFYGDPNWRHNFSGSPMLFWPVGILFLIGLFYSFYKLAKSIVLRSPVRNFVKNINNSGNNNQEFLTGRSVEISAVFGFLIAWWLIMLLPGVLTSEGIPHALRTSGVIPVVYIFVGLGGWKVYEFLNQNTTKKTLLFIASFLFLLSMGISEFNKYFVKWAGNPNVEGAFTQKFADIGYYLNSLPDNIPKYVIVNEPGVPVPWPEGIPMPAQTLMFIERTKFGEPRAVYLKPEDLEKIKPEKETIIIPMK